jgi:hypothetical protein
VEADDIEPLEPDLWQAAITEFLQRVQAPNEPVSRALRHAFHLIQLVPREWRGLLRVSVDETTFETLLQHGAVEVAAYALMPLGPCGVLRLEGTEPAGALFQLSSDAPAHTFRAPSVVLAMLGAWSKSLLEFATLYGSDQALAQRTYLDERHQTQTWH